MSVYIRESVDVDIEVEFEHVEEYIEWGLSDSERERILEILKKDTKSLMPENTIVLTSGSRYLGDEIAAPRLQELIDQYGIETIVNKLTS